MEIESQELEVTDNEAEQQYEVRYDGQLAVLRYFVRDGTIFLVHTEVPKALEGHGIAARLTQYALNDAGARGLRVNPRCPYVRRYVETHHDWDHLLVAGER